MITAAKLHHDIRKVIRAIDFVSDTVYTLNGARRDMEQIRIEDPANTLSGSGLPALEQKYLNVLITDIYNNLYHAASVSDDELSYESDSFIAALSKANHGTGVWEEGWQLVGKDSHTGNLIVRKKTMNFWVEQDRVRPLENGLCLVKVEKECRHLNGYFYYAYGNTDKTQLAAYDGQSLRFYWNLQPAATIPYMDIVTELLNAAHIVFTTKVLSDPDSYSRSDAGVLYIDRSQLEDVLALIPRIYDRVRIGIRPTVPLFVRQLLPGVGFAEDPANGLSFGISRSKLIAETLYHCFRQGIPDHTQLEEELEAAFSQASVAAAHPYARAGNVLQYESIIYQQTRLWKQQ